MKYPKIELPEGAGAKLVKVGAVVALFFFGKKLLANAAKDSADKNLDTDPAAGQARALNAAMNPSGNNWMRSFDGHDTNAIMDVAGQITNLDKVRELYSAQTEGRNLNDDLESEIGSEGYQKFLALASKGKTGNPKYATVRKDIPLNKWVITASDANVRKTPKKESKYFPGNNIVKLVPKGKLIGVATGKFAYDEKDDVTFIEFYSLGTKEAGKKFFYVAKSQIEYLTNEEKIKREKTDGKIPFEILAGLEGNEEEPQTQVVSLRPTIVYDEQFKELLVTPKNIIIGFPIMSLDAGKKGKYIKVKTVQGNLRWVKAEDVSIQNRL